MFLVIPKHLVSLLKLLTLDDLQKIKTKSNLFNMTDADRTYFMKCIVDGYDEYSVVSLLKEHLLFNRLIRTSQLEDIITSSAIDVYVEFLIITIKQYILDTKPELIHKII